MEQTGVMSEETWSSLSDMHTSKEDSDYMTQLIRGFSCPNELSGIWSSEQETNSLVYSSIFSNSNECLVSQETSTLSPDDGQSQSGLYLEGSMFLSDYFTDIYTRPRTMPWMSAFGDNGTSTKCFGFTRKEAGEYLFPQINREYLIGSFGDSADKCDLSDIAKFEKHEMGMDQQRQCDLPNAPESKKRSRNVSRSKRNMKSEKYQKIIVSENHTKSYDGNTVVTKKSSMPQSPEEHSSITEEFTKETLCIKTSKTSSGKGKSGKGASSDPQSLYARKRRERINERLRILQGLVPNGTKVDLSTMLEEAVHYVKFLQLQIKLLSSDDTWMYAPLAYNGMDIGIRNFDTTPSTTSPR